MQAADLVFWPEDERAARPGRLGLLGRILAAPCMLEYFHDTPSVQEMRDCLTKLGNLHCRLRRRPVESEELQSLWILSAGRPERVLRELRCEPLSGWPAGVLTAAALLRTRVVVIRDLPEEPRTLLLRLAGAGTTLCRALKELYELPAGAWEVRLVRPMLLALRIEVEKDPDKGRHAVPT